MKPLLNILRIKLIIQKREEVSRKFDVILTFISICVALFVVAVIFLSFGINAFVAFKQVFISLLNADIVTVRMIPLLLCSIGLVIVFKANVWNIGAEGQILIGAVAATWIALFLMPDASSYVVIPCMFILGFLLAGLWALIPATLRAYLDINEIITTLMMNYIAYFLVAYLASGPWMGKAVWGFKQTDLIPPQARLPQIKGTLIHYPTLIIAIIGAMLVYILLQYTKFGFEIRVFGSNPEAAKYAGINEAKVILLTMFISGGLAGIAGVGELAGVRYRLTANPKGLSADYGFTAIIVACLARFNPIAAILVSYLMGGIIVGGYALQTSLNVSRGVVNIFNGLILLSLISAEILKRYKISFKVVKEDESGISNFSTLRNDIA